jgi:hypothetical protein
MFTAHSLQNLKNNIIICSRLQVVNHSKHENTKILIGGCDNINRFEKKHLPKKINDIP